MNGSQFVETLRQLGYPKAKKLDPKGFDWMFEKEDLVPFLQWFCNNLNSANILDPKDIEEYEKLEESEEGVLEGEQLEEALQTLTTPHEKEDVSEEELKISIGSLNSDLKLYKKRKQALIQKRNKLSVHHTALSHRVSRVSSVESKVKAQYKKKLEQSQTDNVEMNESLDTLTQSVHRLTDLYCSDNEAPHFLSQLQLDEYTDAEEKFTQELTTYTKKQFFEGISEMATVDEGSRYEILEISDPESLLIRGERQDVNMSECRELARLQAMYPKSEWQRIQVLGSNKFMCQSVQCIEDIRQCLSKGEFSKDIEDISNTLQERQSTLKLVRRDLAKMEENDLPTLIEGSTSSQASRILTGDYNLKLARQDYFTSKQDQVVSYLVQQRSRNELLTMAFEAEGQGHRDMHRLLTAIQQQLQMHLKSWTDRISLMKDTSLTAARHQRGTVDSRDQFTTRLHHMIVTKDEQDDKQLFLTYSNLVEGAENLRQQKIAVNDNLSTVKFKQQDQLSIIEHNLSTCQDMVYAGSSTTSGRPCLTPRPLVDAMNKLDDLLKKLQSTIKDNVKDIESKKQTLRNDTLLTKERKIFPYFFTNHEQLNCLFEELSSRLQAQRVQ